MIISYIYRLDVPFEKYDLNKQSSHNFINKTNGDVRELHLVIYSFDSLAICNFYQCMCIV